MASLISAMFHTYMGGMAFGLILWFLSYAFGAVFACVWSLICK